LSTSLTVGSVILSFEKPPQKREIAEAHQKSRVLKKKIDLQTLPVFKNRIFLHLIFSFLKTPFI